MQIKINNKTYEAKLGETVLEVCKREGIRIPNLCSYGKLEHQAVCRLCLVETNRTDRLVTACSFKVCDGLEVITESEKIWRSRKTNLELLFVDHAGKCAKCKKNQRCELQKLAMEEKIDNFHLVPKLDEMTDQEESDLLKDNKSRTVFENKNKVIERNGELCIKCRRCIGVCPTGELGLQKRAAQMSVGTPYNEELDCIFCGKCLDACPTGALTDQNDLEKIISNLDNLKKQSVAILDPAILSWAAKEFPEIQNEEKLVGLLKEIGFEKVFSLREGIGEWILETEKEIKKTKEKPLFLNQCQSFGLYLEKYQPEFLKNLSKVSLPDEIMAKKIKTQYAEKEKINPKNILVFSISHCVAKKTISSKFLDGTLTERELGRIARIRKTDVSLIKELKLDGEMKKKISSPLSLLVKDKNIEAVSVSGIGEIKKLLDRIGKNKVKCDIIEALICEEGCEGKFKV